MGSLSDYINDLSEDELKLMYGSAYQWGLKGIYQALAHYADPPLGDLLILTKRDMKVLRDGEVVQRLTDTAKTEDLWRRESSTFQFDDRYLAGLTTYYYRRYFPLIIERDPVLQHYVRLLDRRPGEVVIRLNALPN